jgi:hypothetical protein
MDCGCPMFRAAESACDVIELIGEMLDEEASEYAF